MSKDCVKKVQCKNISIDSYRFFFWAQAAATVATVLLIGWLKSVGRLLGPTYTNSLCWAT